MSLAGRTIGRHVPALKELCKLVLQYERFPFRTFMSNSMQLRNGTIYRVPQPPRLRTPPRSRSPTPQPPRPPLWQAPKPMPRLSRVKAGRVSKQWPAELKYKRPAGFVNPGNFCYRRSMLQCLLHLPVFYNFLGNTHFKCDEGTGECIVCALQALAEKYWLERDASNFPDGWIELLDNAIELGCSEGHWFHEWATPRVQGDPMGYFAVLREELGKKEHPRIRRLDRMLQLKYIQYGNCEDCGSETVVKDSIVEEGIAVPIMDADGKATDLSLMDYLRQYHTDFVQVTCNDCRQLKAQLFGEEAETEFSTRTQQLKILEAPDMLIVQLKRYNTQGKKLDGDVPFLQDLDLTEFTDDGSQLRYRLYGVVGHRGRTVNSGHYVAAVRDADDDGFTLVNDKNVGRKGSFPVMTNAGYSWNRFPPYILLYQRLD